MIKLILASTILASAAVTASATTVAITFNVTPSYRQSGDVGELVAASQFAAPPPFLFTFTLDLAGLSQSVWVDSPEHPPHVETLLDSGANMSTKTPFTGDMAGGDRTPLGPASTYARIYSAQHEWAPRGNIAIPTTQYFQFVTAEEWHMTGGDGETDIDYYSRSILWERLAWMAFDDLAPMTSERLLTFMQSQVGVTVAGGFVEHTVSHLSGSRQGHGIAANYVVGDFTIQSVAMVPEPGTYTLIGSGLLALGSLGCCRRAAAAKHQGGGEVG